MEASPPRVADWSTLRISAMPRNMSVSSTQTNPMWPKGILMPLTLLGLSQPRNSTSWPVERLRMRRVESGTSYSSSSPRALMDHVTWA